MTDQEPQATASPTSASPPRVFLKPPADWKSMTREEKIAWAEEALAPLFPNQEPERTAPQ